MRSPLVALLLAVSLACTPRESATPAPTGSADAGTISAPADASVPIESVPLSDASATADATAITDAFQRCMSGTGDCHELAPRGVRCPPAFPSPALQGACGWWGVTTPATCTYGTTTCRCELRPYCGGPAPPPALQSGMVWSCRSALKVDECPRERDEIATATCTTAGKKCSVSDCSAMESCTCTGGRWTCTHLDLPPRP